MSKDKTSVRGAMALANSFAAAWARDEMIENPRTFRAPEAEEKLRDYLERLVAETRVDAAGVAREVEQIEAVQAQPSGKPVAWCRIEAWQSGKEYADDCFVSYFQPEDEGWVPLYAASPSHSKEPGDGGGVGPVEGKSQ